MAVQEAMADRGTARTAGRSQTSVVHHHIRTDIICGRLAPGLRLKIEDLQERYGVSATPLREALSLLSATGLVERVDQRGFRVRSVSVGEFEDILWTRCFVEERALRESLIHGSTEWEERIVLALHHLSRASEQIDAQSQESLEQWEINHSRFHAAIISGCASTRLLQFCAQLYSDANRYRYVARLTPGAQSGAYEEHKRIAEAVLRRDPDAAVNLLMAHFRRVGPLLRERISEIQRDRTHRKNV